MTSILYLSCPGKEQKSCSRMNDVGRVQGRMLAQNTMKQQPQPQPPTTTNNNKQQATNQQQTTNNNKKKKKKKNNNKNKSKVTGSVTVPQYFVLLCISLQRSHWAFLSVFVFCLLMLLVVVVFYQFGTVFSRFTYRVFAGLVVFMFGFQTHLLFISSSTTLPCPSTAILHSCDAIGRHVDNVHAALSGHLYKPFAVAHLMFSTHMRSIERYWTSHKCVYRRNTHDKERKK